MEGRGAGGGFYVAPNVPELPEDLPALTSIPTAFPLGAFVCMIPGLAGSPGY